MPRICVASYKDMYGCKTCWNGFRMPKSGLDVVSFILSSKNGFWEKLFLESHLGVNPERTSQFTPTESGPEIM